MNFPAPIQNESVSYRIRNGKRSGRERRLGIWLRIGQRIGIGIGGGNDPGIDTWSDPGPGTGRSTAKVPVQGKAAVRRR